MVRAGALELPGQTRAEAAAPSPVGSKIERRFDQRPVGIGKDPALGARDYWSHETEQAAGASAEIDEPWPHGQPLGQDHGKRPVAGRIIEPFAQGEPVCPECQRPLRLGPRPNAKTAFHG